MLLSEMNEHDRELYTLGARHWIPRGAELLDAVDLLWCGWECDHAAALIRLPDGSVKVKILAGVHAVSDDPLAMLEKRIAAYEEAVRDTRRFIEIARVALDEPKAWGSGNVWEDLGLPDLDDD